MIASGREIDDGEIERDHLSPVAGRDAPRLIRRTCVNNNEFAGQTLYRIEAAGKVALFVLHNHAETERVRQF